jgi:MFS family permease
MPTDFKKLMTARFLFTFAVQMQAVAMGWQIYHLSHDPLALGLVGLVEAFPALGLSLYAGYIIDRSRPLTVYKRVILVSFFSGLVILISSAFADRLPVGGQMAALYGAAFITGIARAFSQPAMFTLIPQMLTRDKFSKGSAWMSTASQMARIGGPAAGGIIFGYFGIVSTAVTICALLVACYFYARPISVNVKGSLVKGEHSVKTELLLGLKFVFQHPILLPALSLDMISVLFGGVTALLPIYAVEVLAVGPRGLGLLRAAPAVGAALTSLWFTRRTFNKRAGFWLLNVVTGFGISILVFALSKNFILSVFALLVSGAFDSVSMIIRGAAVQMASPEAMRGRISAVNSIFIGSSNELGEFESGVAARFLGTVPAAVLGGVVCLATVGFIAAFAPKLRRLDLDSI